jgi:Cu2+-exporting ATPase
MVIVVAGGVAAKHGCIFKTATTIEIARKTSHVVFDKTGTLTQGQLSVAVEKYFETEQHIAAAVYALVSNIKHPVSVAVKKSLESKITFKHEATNVTSHIGKGVEGRVDGRLVKAGNSRWLGFDEEPAAKNFLSQGYTTLCATVDGKLVAIFGLQDSLRSDARQTVAELQRRGIEVSIVSGDDEGPVSLVARQLSITSIRSKCSPADKLQFMKNLTNAGKITIFCGDGTNDAAALAQATIGVHMNEGTDVAQSAADVVLIRSSLIGILTLIDLSKASMLRIAFNFGWSFVYNTLAILFASGALINVRIPPKFAGLGELVSVLPVIAIAMQLRWAKFSKIPTIG